MHFFGARFPDKLHDTGACGAADNRIIHQDHPLPLDFRTDRIKLDADQLLTLLLSRRNKGSADIFVFDESDAVRDAGLPRIPNGSIQSRVRDTNHDICIHRMLQCKERTCS